MSLFGRSTSTSSPAKQQMSDSERRKMAAIGGDLFAGSRDRRTISSAPSSSSTAATPLSPSTIPSTGVSGSRAAASPAPTPSSAATLTASPSVGSVTASNDTSDNSTSATSRPQMIDVRQQSLESKLASDMESARDRPVHLPSTWVTSRPPLAAEIQAALVDDWLSYGSIPGEKLVMRIEPVQFCRADMAYSGTLVMTSYQLYFEPVRPDPKLTSGHPLGGGKLSIPLSTIERIEMEKAEVVRKKGEVIITHMIDLTCKDMRSLRFGFSSQEMCKRAHTCLDLYVFPNKEDYLFAFNYRIDRPFPAEIDGWKLYDMDREYKRMGLPSRSFRFTEINREYKLCNSYPQVLCVPCSISDTDLQAVGGFRSRHRIPALSWCHPNGQSSIWRCSQPRVGMNMARCPEDEKLLMAITDLNANNKNLQIFDCRPKINAVGNKFAGKGYEITDFYKNATVRFMNIENIHVMRDSYQKITKACLRNAHDSTYVNAVAAAGWLNHVSGVLQSTHAMVSAVDREKASILSHCSDGWDRTTQLVSLTALCLDPYYRTLEGFFVMVEKDWLSFGHKFHQRTGHRDKNYADDQRAPIFLQWCDAVYQLTEQFPRHFQFNSHLLVTMMNHLYSCRFGTFFFNSDRKRKKFTVAQRTVSLWTYLLGSPAAHAGEFINPFYAPNGDGVDDFSGVPSMIPQYDDTTSAAIDATTSDANDSSTVSTPPMAIPGSSQSRRPTTVASLSSPSPPTGSPTLASSVPSSSSNVVNEDKLDRSQSISTAPTSSAASTNAASAAAAATATLFPTGGNLRGAVLYPNWSMKKLSLWSDYFMRWTADDGAFGAMGSGSVAPYGSTTPGFASSQAVLHRHTHRLINDSHHLVTELTRARSKINDLEAELKTLRAVAAAATAAAAAAAAATPSTSLIGSSGSDSKEVAGATRDMSAVGDNGNGASTTSATVAATTSNAVAVGVVAVNGTKDEQYEMMMLNHDGTQIPSLLHQTPADSNPSSSSTLPATATAAMPITAGVARRPSDSNPLMSSTPTSTTSELAAEGAQSSSSSSVTSASASASSTSAILSSLLGDDDSSTHDALLGTTRLSGTATTSMKSASNPFDDAPLSLSLSSSSSSSLASPFT